MANKKQDRSAAQFIHFEIPEPLAFVMHKETNLRREKHGDEKVRAIDIFLERRISDGLGDKLGWIEQLMRIPSKSSGLFPLDARDHGPGFKMGDVVFKERLKISGLYGRLKPTLEIGGLEFILDAVEAPDLRGVVVERDGLFFLQIRIPVSNPQDNLLEAAFPKEANAVVSVTLKSEEPIWTEGNGKAEESAPADNTDDE